MLVKRDVDTDSLNPYSTGSNSNSVNLGSVESTSVLILILLEVTQILRKKIRLFGPNGVLILILLEVTQILTMPKSCPILKVLILILLEVTQIENKVMIWQVVTVS